MSYTSNFMTVQTWLRQIVPIAAHYICICIHWTHSTVAYFLILHPPTLTNLSIYPCAYKETDVGTQLISIWVAWVVVIGEATVILKTKAARYIRQGFVVCCYADCHWSFNNLYS